MATTQKKERDRKKHAFSMTCDGSRDLIVTDPCYLYPDPDEWEHVISLFEGMGTVNGALAPQELTAFGLTMGIADTIFGDWYCAVWDRLQFDIGTFGADAGLVCCAYLPYKEAVHRLKGIPRKLWLRIPKFAGMVRICHQNGRCWVEGSGSYTGGRLPGFKSTQIG